MSDFLLTTLSFLCDQWVVVVTKGTCYQDQKWLIDISDFRQFEEFVITNRNEGYRITDVCTRGNFYSVVLSSGINLSDQVWERSTTFPDDWVNEQIDNGYFISAIAGTEEEWFVVCSKMDHVEFEQTWILKKNFPEGWIYKQSADGFKINVLATGPQGWVVVLNKTQEKPNGEFQSQDWSSSANPTALCKWGISEPGMKVQAISGEDDEMTIIRTEMPSHGEQKTMISQTFPESWVRGEEEDTESYKVEDERLFTVRSSRGESMDAPLLLSSPTEKRNSRGCPCCTIL